METVPIQLADGTSTPVRLFPAERAHPITLDAPRPVVVIIPGLDVPGIYYSAFAADLARRGFDVAVAELRGQGDSTPKAHRGSRYGYHELVSVDFPAIFGVVRDRFPDSTPYVLGHSVGGQLAVMYAARVRGRLGGIILVASGTPYFRGFAGAASPGMLVGSLAIPAVAGLAGRRIGLAGWEQQSPVMISDWARLARTGRFDPADADINYDDRIARLRLPVLSITIAGDAVAPAGSAQHLLDKMPNAEITKWRQPLRVGHNGWIRRPGTTADRIDKWLRDR